MLLWLKSRVDLAELSEVEIEFGGLGDQLGGRRGDILHLPIQNLPQGQSPVAPKHPRQVQEIFQQEGQGVHSEESELRDSTQ